MLSNNLFLSLCYYFFLNFKIVNKLIYIFNSIDILLIPALKWNNIYTILVFNTIDIILFIVIYKEITALNLLYS